MTVKAWRDRFAEDGLKDFSGVRPGRGRKPSFPAGKVEEIVRLTLRETPAGETNWSCRTMAARAGVSPATVQRIWSAGGLAPHRVETFKLSNDPRFRRSSSMERLALAVHGRCCVLLLPSTVDGVSCVLRFVMAGLRIWWRLGWLMFSAIVVGLVWAVGPASAQTFVLSSCSANELAATVVTANSNDQNDEIVLKPGCTYVLSRSTPGTNGGALEIKADNGHSLWIYGSGDATIGGDSTARGIWVDSGAKVTLGQLTLNAANTCSSCGAASAAVDNAGTVVLNDTTIERNAVGIISDGANSSLGPATTTVIHSTVSNNTDQGIVNYPFSTTRVSYSTVTGNTGVGIDNASENAPATVNVFASTISGNTSTACLSGGGILNGEDGDLTVGASTVSNNTTTCTSNAPDAQGGGIRNRGTATIINSTVADNSAYTGGGIYEAPNPPGETPGRIAVIWSTLSGNTATSPYAFSGADIRSDATDGVSLKASIVADGIAGNASGGDCAGRATKAMVDEGYNVADDGSCDLFKSQHSLSRTSAGLSSAGLADNGGPTETIALLPSSPANDYVPLSLSPPSHDQRLLPRPDGTESVVDIGAYELQDGADLSGPRTAQSQGVVVRGWVAAAVDW